MKSLWLRLWLRRVAVFALVMPVLAGVALLALVGLIGTPPGMNFALTISNRLCAPVLSIGTVSGSLFSTLHLHDIRYADGIDTVRIDKLALSWEPAQLFSGQVQITSVQGSGVEVLRGEGSGNIDLPTLSLPPFSLPLPLKLDALLVENIRIVSGQSGQSDQDEPWQIHTLTFASLSYQGDLLHLREGNLDSPGLALQAAGQMRTSAGYPLQLHLTARLQPEGYSPIQGRVVLQGPINELAVEASLDAPFAAQIKGVLSDILATPRWSAQVKSRALQLSDMQKTWPGYAFFALVAEAQGTLDEYVVHLRGQGVLPGRSDRVDFVTEFQGDTDGLRVDTLKLRHQKTEVAAQGKLGWNPQFSWQADVQATHLNPGLLHADWPGDIAVALTSSGQSTGQGLKASLHLSKLQGKMRKHSLAGSGKVSLENQQLHISNLQLRSGSSALHLKGSFAEKMDVQFRLDSPDIAEFWPGARGTMHINGRVEGSAEKPAIDCTLSGTNVGIDANSIRTLQMEAKGVLSDTGTINGLLRAERLQLGALSMATAQLRLSGSPQRHRVEFAAKDSLFAAGFSVDGAVGENRWQGSLGQARFSSQGQGEWRQQKPVSLEVSADKASLSSLCLGSTASSKASSTVCAEAIWHQKANAWQLHGTAASLPLALLYALPRTSGSLAGLINAEVDLAGQADQILSAQLSVINTDLGLMLPLTEQRTHQMRWKKNALQAHYAKGQLQASLESALTDGSVIQATGTSAVNQPFLEQILRAPMNGSVQLQIRDLSPLIALTDRAIHPTGMLQGQLTFKGTPQAPVFKGALELVDGQAVIPPLGITLSPLTLNLTGDAHNLRLHASAHSGKGVLTAESEVLLNRLTTGPYSIRFTGESFKAAHIPGLDLDISPDILVVLNQRRVEARGSVTVPYARIASIDFSQGLSPSADMVVLDETEQGERLPVMPFFAELAVITGDDVLIDAHGLRASIDGSLTIHQQPGRPQIGKGTLSVRKGSYTVYGRRLKIDLGRLLFTGGPLTNPGVELRSEKKNEKLTTGVTIDGFLQRPELHFYSSPVVEQSVILTNLLESTALGGETRQDTGFIGTVAAKIGLGGVVPYLQDVKQLTMIDEIKLEFGESYDSFALVFGSWLTPDFYVSYGKDFAKESGNFNTRYNLGSGFFFLTETGASHSGGDIKYEFEY